ncbi:MAG: hypothetical protein ACREF1_00720, partial [Acetobacteraceae bacterium]
MTPTRFSRALLLAGATMFLGQQAIAQGANGSNGPGWFMPGQSTSGASRPAARTRAAGAKPAEPGPGPAAEGLGSG